MANNKVQLADGTTLMDISDSTVTEDALLDGVVAYNAAGDKIVGTMRRPTTPYMEAEYIAEVSTAGSTNHYIKSAKLYNHTAIYASEFSGQHKLQNLDFSDASNNITAIESNAFQGAQVNGLVLPSTISVLGRECFTSASIATLTVPPLVTVLPRNAFSYIQSIYNAETGEELSINIILPQNLIKIGAHCFDCAQIEQITIPDTVTEIGNNAFYYCDRLASITLSLGLQKISDYMFTYCRSLTSITIPEAVTEIGVRAFESSGLTTITIPSTVTTLGSGAFRYCESLTSMDIQATVTAIPDEFATECPLTSLTLPSTLQTIGAYAFAKNDGFQVTELTIPASVTSIGDFAFGGNNPNQMTLTVLPTTPPTLGSTAFNLAAGSVIKVPAASVAAYKAADGWSNYASYIVAM